MEMGGEIFWKFANASKEYFI